MPTVASTPFTTKDCHLIVPISSHKRHVKVSIAPKVALI
jgi:hypothetical protein